MKVAAVVVLLVAAGSALAAPITPGNLVLYRVGTGTGSLVNTGNAVFVDEFTPAGVLVQSIPMPTSASGANLPLIASGTATSEGFLTVSPNGQYVTVTGYGTTTGGSSLAGTTGAAVPRVVGILNAGTGTVNTSTGLTDFASSNNPRSAVTTNGSDIWVAGAAGGARYATLGATTSVQLSTTVTNLRQINIFSGQLYVSDSSGSTSRLGAIGGGLPTTSGQTITSLPGFPSATGSPYAYFLADLNAGVVGVDTLYVADDTAGTGGILKYSLVGGTWVSNGVLGVAADAYRGLTGSVDALGNVQLFATRKGGSAAAGGGELVSVLDATGYNATISGSINLLATAGANTAYRGVGYVTPTPGSLALLGLAGIVAGRRRRSA